METSFLKNVKPHFESEETYFIFDRHKFKNPSSMANCHYHNGYEIYYLHEGERLYFIKDKTYHIKKGDIVLINPNEIHATINIGNSVLERSLISFNHDYLKNIDSFFPDISFFDCFKKENPVISTTPHERLVVESILDDIHNKYSKQEASSDCFKFMLMEFLFKICAHNPLTEEKKDDKIPLTYKTITSVMAYINNNYSEDLSLDSVSKAFYMSSFYLSRLFKKSVGMSFIDYVNNVRIKEAKTLLTTTNESIINISQNVGFKSNTHFGRVFKCVEGISPLQYRKLHTKK